MSPSACSRTCYCSTTASKVSCALDCFRAITFCPYLTVAACVWAGSVRSFCPWLTVDVRSLKITGEPCNPTRSITGSTRDRFVGHPKMTALNFVCLSIALLCVWLTVCLLYLSVSISMSLFVCLPACLRLTRLFPPHHRHSPRR